MPASLKNSHQETKRWSAGKDSASVSEAALFPLNLHVLIGPLLLPQEPLWFSDAGLSAVTQVVPASRFRETEGMAPPGLT